MDTPLLRYARAYVKAGISVIPLVCDGSKAPALPTGAPQLYSQRLPTDDELSRWFGTYAKRGIGLKCGAVSGGLEVIDFDMHQLLEPVLSLISRELRRQLTIVETPGGWHLMYRCPAIKGSKKLAMWEQAQSLSEQQGYREGAGLIGKGVRIETRGEGGYVVGEGSSLDVHPSGLPYVQAFGPRLPVIEYITPDDRAALWHVCRSFCCERKSKALPRKVRQIVSLHYMQQHVPSDGNEPWTWFDEHADVAELLRQHDWTSNDEQHWTRPGKESGTSAMLRVGDGVPILTVFSSSAGALAPEDGGHQSYGPFALLSKLKFDGDRSRAASYVRGLMRGGK